MARVFKRNKEFTMRSSINCSTRIYFLTLVMTLVMSLANSHEVFAENDGYGVHADDVWLRQCYASGGHL